VHSIILAYRGVSTVVLPNEGTFVFTGDIEFMWLRDSVAQVDPLLLPIFPSNNHHHHLHHHHAIELEQQQPQQHNLPDTNH
jgi:meiotically up-regulated gene 157 (Mug157) protein